MNYERQRKDRLAPQEVFSAQLNLAVFANEQREPNGFQQMQLVDGNGVPAWTDDGLNHYYEAVQPDGHDPVMVDDPAKPKFKRFRHRLAEFVVVEKAADGTVVQEITVEESDIPKPLRDAFRDAGRAILDDIIANTPE